MEQYLLQGKSSRKIKDERIWEVKSKTTFTCELTVSECVHVYICIHACLHACVWMYVCVPQKVSIQSAQEGYTISVRDIQYMYISDGNIITQCQDSNNEHKQAIALETQTGWLTEVSTTTNTQLHITQRVMFV